MKILLDTSGYVGFKRGTEELVDSITSAEAVLFSPVVLGELMFGFRNGNRFKKNMDELNKFLDHEKDGELHYPLCSNIHPVIYDLRHLYPACPMESIFPSSPSG